MHYCTKHAWSYTLLVRECLLNERGLRPFGISVKTLLEILQGADRREEKAFGLGSMEKSRGLIKDGKWKERNN